MFAKENMSKKMLIDATHAEETRVVVVEGNKVEEFDFESLNKRQLAGNIYLAKVTRVEPSLQAAFVDYGGNRHGFLAFSEIHPDYYQIPVADREALLAEEEAFARQQQEQEDEEKPKRKSGRSRRRSSKASNEGVTGAQDALATQEIEGSDLVEDLPETSLTDVPPPNAASGEVEIEVVEPPETGEDASEAGTETDAAADSPEPVETDDAAVEEDAVEQVGAEDVKEEIVPRRARPRRYKIQEVIKVRQILLVQVVKEERGNKGAALTTYLSLAGRYCVLMPNTARGGGISRKITNASDRKKLKDIASDISVPKGAGLIIRTAGAQRTKTEIKRDYEYLLRQWEQIRDLTMKSIAPAPIYEEGSLIKRTIRDLYSRDIDEIFVDGERGYREAKDYMKMLMPSHAKNVKLYGEALPLFSRYQVENYLSAMFNPTVQLRSGGYIVIDVTEALVAVDVNSGRATKESSIEDTALKTNLEAAEELARQARLRDLAGLIVIDFIDMEDRRNNSAVEKRLKDRLKTDRARIQIGRISSFGLLEMSRQRLRPGMLEATTAPCPHCHGTGRTRSDDSLALAIMRELEEEGVRRRSKEVLVTVPVDIANYLLNQKREHVAQIEARFGLSVRIEASPTLISPEYSVEKFKTATRILPEPEMLNEIAITSMPDMEEMADETVEEEPREAETPRDAEQPKKRRRRRRRRGGSGQQRNENTEASNADADEAVSEPAEAQPTEASQEPDAEDAPKPKRKRRSSKKSNDEAAETVTAEPVAEADAEEKPKPKSRTRSRKKVEPVAEPVVEIEEAPATMSEAPIAEDAAPAKPGPKPRARVSAKAMIAEVKAEPSEAQTDEPVAEGDKPKRKGWWSRAVGK